MDESAPLPRTWWTTARRAPWELWAYVVLTIAFALVHLVTFPRWIHDDYAVGVVVVALVSLGIDALLVRFLLAGSVVAWWCSVVFEVMGALGTIRIETPAWLVVNVVLSLAMLGLLLHFNVRTWVSLTPDARAVDSRLPPRLRGMTMPAYSPAASLTQVTPAQIDMGDAPRSDARRDAWFCVFVDHGQVLAWAVRSDLVDGGVAELARIAEAVNFAYWGDIRQASVDVAARFTSARALEEIIGEVPADGVFAVDGAATVDVAAACRAALTSPIEHDID